MVNGLELLTLIATGFNNYCEITVTGTVTVTAINNTHRIITKVSSQLPTDGILTITYSHTEHQVRMKIQFNDDH